MYCYKKNEHEKQCSNIHAAIKIGLGVILDSSIHSFTRTNGTIKNNPIVPEKEWNAKNTFLKILEQNGKEWNGTDISLKERVKSGTCSYYQERILS